jgi:cytochrome c5
MRFRIGILGVVFATAFCTAHAADLSPSETKAAKRIYVAKCAKCHKFYDPAVYDRAQWDMWMKKMGKKSKLKPEQHQLLSRYLETLRTPRNKSLNR